MHDDDACADPVSGHVHFGAWSDFTEVPFADWPRTGSMARWNEAVMAQL